MNLKFSLEAQKTRLKLSCFRHIRSSILEKTQMLREVAGIRTTNSKVDGLSYSDNGYIVRRPDLVRVWSSWRKPIYVIAKSSPSTQWHIIIQMPGTGC